MGAIDNLKNIDVWSVFYGLMVFILFGQMIYKTIVEGILQKFEIETKSMRQKREDHELLVATANGLQDVINELKELSLKHEKDIRQMYDDNITHRDQSRSIRNDFRELIDSIGKKLDAMQKKTDERFLETEKKNNKRIRAELKDKIGQSYRYYHQKQEINDMEFEALEDLIKEYESANGENSFVHSVVQKEMYTWRKIERK